MLRALGEDLDVHSGAKVMVALENLNLISLEDALEMANCRIADWVPRSRVILKSNLTGQVYDEKRLRALMSQV